MTLFSTSYFTRIGLYFVILIEVINLIVNGLSKEFWNIPLAILELALAIMLTAI